MDTIQKIMNDRIRRQVIEQWIKPAAPPAPNAPSYTPTKEQIFFRGTYAPGNFGRVMNIGKHRCVSIDEKLVVRDWTRGNEGTDECFPTAPVPEAQLNWWKKNVRYNKQFVEQRNLSMAHLGHRHHPVQTNTIKHKDVPAYIIGSGPSLRDDVNYLKGVKKGIIIAQNASVKMLAAEGITPDYYFAIDYVGRCNPDPKCNACQLGSIPVPCNREHVRWDKDINGKTIDWRNTTAILSMTCAPYVAHWGFKDVVHFNYSEANNYSSHLAKEMPWMGRLDSGYHTTYSAFQFAYEAGCNPIIFVGCDYGFIDNKMHLNEDLAKPDDPKYQKFMGFKWVKTDNHWNRTLAEMKSESTYLLMRQVLLWACFFVGQERVLINASSAGLLDQHLGNFGECDDMFINIVALNQNALIPNKNGDLIMPNLISYPLELAVETFNRVDPGICCDRNAVPKIVEKVKKTQEALIMARAM